MRRLSTGDRVALLVGPSLAYLDAVWSMLARGVVPIPLDPRLTRHEVTRILAPLEPTVVVTDAAGLGAVTTGDRGLPRARPMHCTSGTTGTPKGVWSGLLPDDDAAALVAEEREAWGFAADDVNLVVSPLYHSAPLRFALGTRLAGGHAVLCPFDPVAVTEAITAERPTTLFVVPTHLQRLFAYWDRVGVPDLSSFRLLAHAGAPCPAEVKQRLVELFPAGSTWEFYGSTEGQFTACRSEEWLERPGTVGRARPGRSLAVDGDGTIWCTVPRHARFEYYGDPEKTAAAWRTAPDGSRAFTVGDVGRLDDDGYLYLDGRRHDLIISGGVNVYPLEVEQVLESHPGVVEAAVFGAEDPDWGQRVCAAVVGSASEADLAAYVREHLAPPKRPKSWTFVDELPRTLTGKVRRDRLSAPGRSASPSLGPGPRR